jgi:putative FmdB family regulatory protein
MPLYDYHCLDCQEDFEVHHGMNEEPVVTHACGGKNVKQKFVTSALHFKGPGFFVNDYPKGK